MEPLSQQPPPFKLFSFCFVVLIFPICVFVWVCVYYMYCSIASLFEGDLFVYFAPLFQRCCNTWCSMWLRLDLTAAKDDQCDQIAREFILYFAFFNKENSPTCAQNLPKLAQKCQILNERFQNGQSSLTVCQSGEYLPNLVSLKMTPTKVKWTMKKATAKLANIFASFFLLLDIYFVQF